MLNYRLTHEALAFLRKIPTKHAKQIVGRIEQLAQDPSSIPIVQLQGHAPLRPAKSGEYRIIYRLTNGVVEVHVLRIGKRNDGEVYRDLQNLSDKP